MRVVNLVHVRASETSTIINSKHESLPTGCLSRFLSHTHPHAHHQINQSVLNKNRIKTPVATTLMLRVIDVICLSSSSVNEIPRRPAETTSIKCCSAHVRPMAKNRASPINPMRSIIQSYKCATIARPPTSHSSAQRFISCLSPCRAKCRQTHDGECLRCAS